MAEFERVVVAGDGDLSFGMGFEKNKKVPFLAIRQLLETSEVGVDSMEMESVELLTIVFKNLESIAILEKMCGKVREYLEAQDETSKDETIEEYYLSSIKNVLAFGNDAQAIRFMEKYYQQKCWVEGRRYSEEEVKKLLSKFHIVSDGTKKFEEEWFEQNKKH